MSEKTKIQWTDATWNPIRGCSRVSDGCRNCYAERTAARFQNPGQPYHGLITKGRWNGVVRLIEEHLNDPLKWKEPRRIFVNSMSDLFHESLKVDAVVSILEIMKRAPQHQFQVLTKRPKIMQNVMDYYYQRYLENEEARRGYPWTNIWLGVSVENQKTADERIPLLLHTPAAVRFISAEPLLGPLDLSKHLVRNTAQLGQHLKLQKLDWVIVGGESGRSARAFDINWGLSIVEQCREAGVPVFVKQLGSKPYKSPASEGETGYFISLVDKKGGNPDEWDPAMRVREFPR